jgi:hypothetical protein
MKVIIDMCFILLIKHLTNAYFIAVISCEGVRHGYPWVPTDQAHGRPLQVGPAYQKTRRPVCGPNRPSWWPTRPPEDLPEDPQTT